MKDTHGWKLLFFIKLQAEGCAKHHKNVSVFTDIPYLTCQWWPTLLYIEIYISTRNHFALNFTKFMITYDNFNTQNKHHTVSLPKFILSQGKFAFIPSTRASRIFEKVNVTSTILYLHENPALIFCLHMSFLKYLNGYTKRRCTKHKLLLTSSLLKRIVWNLFQISSNCPISKWTAWKVRHFPANICLFKFNSRNTRKRCEICSKLTMKTPERRQWRFIVNFEHISHLFLVFLLLTLNK